MGEGRKMWARRVVPYYIRNEKFRLPRNLLYMRWRNQKKLEQQARTGALLRHKLLDSGFWEGPTWGALIKAWLAYIISFKHDDWERRKYYAAVIQKLEGELHIEKFNFEEVKFMAADFLEQFQNYPDIAGMSVEEIEAIMRKSDTEFWQNVNG